MNDELTRLRSDYAAKMAEAKAKNGEFAAGKATAAEVDALLGQADEIKAKMALQERIAAGEDFLNGSAGPQAAHLGWRDAGPTEGMPAVDGKAWRQIEVADALGFKRQVRYHVPLAVQAKGYAPAFEAYLRGGDQKLGPTDRKVLTEGVDTAGGFLVPEDAQTEILKRTMAAAAMRPLCREIQTSRDVVKWPRVNYSADDIYTSGVRLTWTGEQPALATTHRVTDPVFGETRIDVHTAMASMPLSNDLLEDSAFDVWGIVAELFGEAYALGEDQVFTLGDGISKPMGLLTQANGGAGPAGIHSGSAGALTANGFLNLHYGIPAQYQANARYMLSSDAMVKTEQLQDGSNRNLVQPLTVSSLASAPFETIKGKPITLNPWMETVAAGHLVAVYGDFRGYIIVDRVGLSIQRMSDATFASLNQTLALGRKRVGGYCAEPYRLRVMEVAA